jgi:hypothetical protein
MARMVAALLTGTLLLGGCAAPSSHDGPATFVADGSGQPSIIQWTEDADGALTGTYQAAEASTKRDGPPVQTSNASIQGRIAKGSVTLTFDFLTAVTGTLKGDSLELFVSQKSGGVRRWLTSDRPSTPTTERSERSQTGSQPIDQ